MANSALDPGDDLDPDAQRAARLAAMQRALDATPNGSEMNPIGSQEHTPGGQELLGHEGGPNLGDYYKFANDLSGTKPEFIGDTVGRAATSVAGGVAGLGGTTSNTARPNPYTGGSLGSVQSPDAFERNEPVTTALPTTTSTTTAPPIPPGPTTVTTSAPRSTTTTQPFTTTTPTTQPKSTTNGPTTTGPTTTQSGPTTGTTTGPTTQPPSGPTGANTSQIGSGGGDLGSLTTNIVSQIQSLSSGLVGQGASPDAQAVYVHAAQGILDLLNAQEASLRSDYEKQGTVLDPSTTFTLDKLRQSLEDSLTKTRENLNARGLYDSGIELSLENNLRKGNLSDQAQVLGDRMSKLQDQLNTGLSQIRSQRYSTANSYGLAGANAQENANQSALSRAAAAQNEQLQANLALRGQQNTADIAGRNLAQSANESAMQRAFQQSQSQAGYQSAMDLANTNNGAAMQRALLSSRAGGSTASAPTQINPYGGQTKTGNNVSADTTNAAISAIGNATSRSQAQGDLFKAAQKLIDKGVDIQAVQDAIDAQFPPSQEEIRGTRTVGGPI